MRFALHPTPIDTPALLGPPAEKNVFGDGKLGHHTQFLMHGGDAGPHAVHRRPQHNGLAVHNNRTIVRPLDAG